MEVALSTQTHGRCAGWKGEWAPCGRQVRGGIHQWSSFVSASCQGLPLAPYFRSVISFQLSSRLPEPSLSSKHLVCTPHPHPSVSSFTAFKRHGSHCTVIFLTENTGQYASDVSQISEETENSFVLLFSFSKAVLEVPRGIPPAFPRAGPQASLAGTCPRSGLFCRQVCDAFYSAVAGSRWPRVAHVGRRREGR